MSRLPVSRHRIVAIDDEDMIRMFLSGMTGHDIITILKHHSVAKDIPVIFLTGRNNQSEQDYS